MWSGDKMKIRLFCSTIGSLTLPCAGCLGAAKFSTFCARCVSTLRELCHHGRAWQGGAEWNTGIGVVSVGGNCRWTWSMYGHQQYRACSTTKWPEGVLVVHLKGFLHNWLNKDIFGKNRTLLSAENLFCEIFLISLGLPYYFFFFLSRVKEGKDNLIFLLDFH